MDKILIILSAVWLLGGIVVIARRHWKQWRGRRICRCWFCPQCKVPFGDLAGVRQWQRYKDRYGMKSALFSGLVVRCPGCAQDYWFTWTGDSLHPSLRRWFEVVDCRWTWDV